MRSAIFWLPRIGSLAFVAFLSLFALDVFGEYSGPDVVLPLLIHLLPSIGLLVVTAIAWKHDLVGALVFLGFAIFYIWAAGLDRPISWYLAISLPTAAIGLLYGLNWWEKRRVSS